MFSWKGASRNAEVLQIVYYTLRSFKPVGIIATFAGFKIVEKAHSCFRGAPFLFVT
jgi:hypothetical protein